jgi:GTP-binding protein
MKTPIVVILGRPNVGKSTLYNRLVGKRGAIVDNTSGVTRDRNYGESEWSGKKFTLIDTGGYVPASDDVFEKAIREQVEIAINEADAIRKNMKLLFLSFIVLVLTEFLISLH